MFRAVRSLITLVVLLASWWATPAYGQGGPNVLLVLVDDLGRTDLGVDGSTFYETPHLDKLAGSGVRFTDFYSAHPVCSPTRASLMTGKVPQRLGITDWIHPNSGIALSHEEETLAEAFHGAGYQTGYCGKWHLGESDADLPIHHGFDWTRGVNRAGQPGSYYFPFRQSKDHSTVWDVPDFEDEPDETYLTDALTSGAIQFLRERDHDRPFFLCIGHYSIHTPIQPPKGLSQKYEHKRRSLFGAAESTVLEAPNQSSSRSRQDDPAYAAMMENLDDNIGRLVKALDDLQIRENTIVVFTSDNGGLCTTQGKRAGPTCNLPYRSGKGWNYEGGIRVPSIISWPGRLNPSTCQLPAYSADLYPTLLELAGLPAKPLQHRDGRSLVRAMRNEVDEGLRERFLAWYYPHDHGSGHQASAAIRQGDWKLIRSLQSGREELYHLAVDVTEQNDLSSTEPAIAAELSSKLQSWIAETTSP